MKKIVCGEKKTLTHQQIAVFSHLSSQQQSAPTVRSGKLSSWVQIHHIVGTQYDAHIRIQWKIHELGRKGGGEQTTMIKWRFCHGSCYAGRCPTSHQCSFYTLDSYLPTLMRILTKQWELILFSAKFKRQKIHCLLFL